jgi:ABC-2 type transport system permease protein
MYRNLGWMGSVLTMEVRRILSYRVDFWIQFLGSVAAQLGVAFFLWRAIFSYRDVERIGEFSFGAMMLYYLLAPLVSRTVQGAEMGHIAEEIYEGTLTRYLIYPISFFRYKFAAHLAYTLLFMAQALCAAGLFMLFAGIPAEFRLTPATVAVAAAGMVGATYLYFVIIASIEAVAFWADNVWSLVVIVRFATGLLGGAMIPLSLFPPWAHQALSFLPFSYFISFPVRTLLGLNEPVDWVRGFLILGVWAIAATVILAAVWRRGAYRYTGVGI